MKLFKIFFAIFIVALLSSCGTTSPTGGGGFWGGFSGIIDHGISEWKRTMPSDSYDHVFIDAWKSGTGGKTLVVAEIAAGVIGGGSNKDVKALKDRIHNAASNLVKNETFNSNDVNNWVGALFTLGDEFIDEYNSQKFEDAVNKLTDPSNPGYNEEEALRVNNIDYENRKIIWKSNSQYIYDLMKYRKSKNANWISENIEHICGMSIEEYNELPMQKRQDIDLKILAYENFKEKDDTVPQSNTPITEEPTKSNYKTQIEGIVISDYDINIYKLTDEQKNILKKLAEILKEDNSILLQISGHTCSLGSEKVNHPLGLKRAIEAKNYLVNLGIDANRIYTESEGSSHPIADNSNEEGRKHNRRITFNLK